MASIHPDTRGCPSDSEKAVFADDADAVRGMLEAALVLAPYAHASVNAIDIQEALKLEGVHAVLTARDIPGQNNLSTEFGQMPLFAEDCVSFHSQPVAAVIADNFVIAREATGLVRVDYKPRVPVLGIREAIAVQSFHGEEQVLQRGDVNAADEKKLSEINKEFTVGGQDNFSLETCVALAEPGQDGKIKLRTSVGDRGFVRRGLAGLLNVEKSDIRVERSLVGGYGDTSAGALIAPAIAALAAKLSASPVRIGLRRETGVKLTAKQNPVSVIIRAFHDSSACIQSVECAVHLDGGWQIDQAASVLCNILHHLDSAYFFPNIKVSGRICKTNCLSSTSSFSNGTGIAALIVEEIISEVALHLKMNPKMVRERNFYAPGSDRAVTHYGQNVDGLRLRDAWKRVTKLSSYEDRLREISEWNRTSSFAKRGLAVVPVKIGCGASREEAKPVQAGVCLFADGSAQVTCDGVDAGEILRRSVAVIVEEELGICGASVRIAAGDPDQGAALHCDELYAEAVLDACRQLRDRLRMIAAARLGESDVDITDIMELKFSEGGVSDPEHPDMPVSLSEIVDRAIADGIDVKATGCFNALEVLGDRNFRDFACGAAAAEVLIDGFTGEVTVLRVDIVQDVGFQIEPVTAKNLICSAFMRGLGWLTCEELQWAANGELITGEVDSYRVATAGEVPRQFNCELLASQGRYPKDPQAAAFCLALSVREAIRDGIAAFGGAKPGLILPLPASPEAVYFTIETSAP